MINKRNVGAGLPRPSFTGQNRKGEGTSPLQSLDDELWELNQRFLFRRIRPLSNFWGTRASYEGREVILFCGNDYLGLSHDPRVIRAAQRALERYGVGAGAARLISGTSEIHTELEAALARFKNKERALLFGSGYLANLGILTALAREGDLLVMDKLCHASLIDGARLSGATVRVFPHKNYERCEEILSKGRDGSLQAQREPSLRRILVSETVFSMEGDLADLEELVRLKEKYDCLLVVDDAHGIGVFGSEGRGAASGGVEEKIDVVMGTLSKALGVFGGFAAASEVLIDTLINFSRPFIFATAPPPALAAAALEALRLVQEDPSLRERLWANVNHVREFLKTREPSLSPIIPIMIGDESEAVRVSEELLQKGILIPAIRYPTVAKGKARLRLTVSAAHTEEDLGKLFEALAVILRPVSRHCEAAFQTLPKQSL